MPQAMRLLGRKTFLNDHAPELFVVWDNGRQRPDRLAAPSSSLKRVETIFQPVIDVVNLHSPLVGEVKTAREFKAVVRSVPDWSRALALRHSR